MSSSHEVVGWNEPVGESAPPADKLDLAESVVMMGCDDGKAPCLLAEKSGDFMPLVSGVVDSAKDADFDIEGLRRCLCRWVFELYDWGGFGLEPWLEVS